MLGFGGSASWKRPPFWCWWVCSCCSRRLVSRRVRSTLGLRCGGGGGTLAPADSGGTVRRVTGESESPSQGADPRRLRGGGGGGALPSSLAGDERDSVDVQPLVRPPTPGLLWESLSPRPERRALTGARRRLCPLSISSTYLRKSRSSWKPYGVWTE